MTTPLTAAQRDRSRRLVSAATGAVTAITIAGVGAGAALAQRISQTHQVEKAAAQAATAWTQAQAGTQAQGRGQTAVIVTPATLTPTAPVIRQRVQRTVVTTAVVASAAPGVAALGGQPVRAGARVTGGQASVAAAVIAPSSRPASGVAAPAPATRLASAPASRPVSAPAARPAPAPAPAPIKSTGS